MFFLFQFLLYFGGVVLSSLPGRAYRNGNTILTLMLLPSSRGARLTKSGSSSKSWLTLRTTPDTGATMFDTDFTDSITPISSKFLFI